MVILVEELKDSVFMSKDESLLLKGIAIILMLVYHLWNPLIHTPFEIDTIGLFHKEWAAFGSICVSLFVFLSGYGLDASNSCQSISALFKRIKKLYGEFWKVWVPFTLILFIAGYKYLWYDYLLEFIGLRPFINRMFWFICLYVELLIFKYMINRTVGGAKNKLIALFVLSIIVGFCYSTNITHGFASKFYISRFIEYSPCFISGILTYRMGGLLKRSFPSIGAVFLLGLIICVRIWLFYHTELYVKKYADAFLVPLLIWLFFNIKFPSYITKCLRYLGEMSMLIWLTHGYYYVKFSDVILCPRISILVVIWFILISIFVAELIKQSWWLIGFIYTKLKQK